MKIEMTKMTGFVASALLLSNAFLTGCASSANSAAAAVPAAMATLPESMSPAADLTAMAAGTSSAAVLGKDSISRDFADIGPEGETDIDTSALATAVNQATPGQLSESEAASIVFMREEEKLAHDVYLTLYDRWGLNVFNNIASSEQTHTEAVLTLIERYGLEDPAAGRAVGEFVNPDLQALYNELVAQGRQSLVDALKVGAAIEEIDILDLQKYIAQTDKVDIQVVYENLMRGSTNHLRAFVSVMERQGEAYAPQYLDQKVYDEIMASEGNGRRGRP